MNVIKNTIGVGLMIKNEEKELESFLDQCIPFADCVCVVDTGSTDHSKEIALTWSKKTGITLYYIEAKRMVSEEVNGDWLICDFALARNIYLEQLDSLVDYIFTASVGNIIHEPAKIRDLVKSNHKVYGFTVKRGIADFTHHRLFKTKLGIQYHGKVHEYPDVFKVGEAPCSSGLTITHEAGNKTSQESSTKRNLRILERVYKENPSPRTRFYYAMALRETGYISDAIRVYKEYLAGPTPYHDERMFAYYYLLKCYMNTNPTEVIRIGFKALGEDQRFSEITMFMAYAFFNSKKYDKALAMCLLAIQSPPNSAMFIEACKYKEEPLKMINQIQDLKAARKNC